MMQEITNTLCADAEAQLATQFEVISSSTLQSNPLMSKVYAVGKPTPYAYTRKDSQYLIFAPQGQTVIDPTYQMSGEKGLAGMASVFGTVGNAISNAQTLGGEIHVAHELGAAATHINIMVDFADVQGKKAKGFLGKITGQQEAKVTADVKLSVSGFVTIAPPSKVNYSNPTAASVNAKDYVRFTTEEPLVVDSSAILGVRDIQSASSKKKELAGNVLGVLVSAAAGRGSSITSIIENGVDVDPVKYAADIRTQSKKFIGLVSVLAKQ